MKIGLIARCEYARGLAIQSKGFFDHLPVDRVLLVRKHPLDLDCEERPDWYPGATHVTYDHINHTLPQAECMEWLEGLDVVFAVETTYDWRFPDWARNMHVRTVIQGNPEFYRHDQAQQMTAAADYKAHPDAWWWPTRWRTDRLPPGRLVPVPMEDRPCTARTDGEVNFLHVVGKRAFEDRNGTDVIINALRSIEEPCDFTIQGFGWELDPAQVLAAVGNHVPVRVHVDAVGVRDRWSMYDDQSVLVLPRRYGGLCLPALEAAACGMAVSMPAVSPNVDLASDLFPARDDRVLRLACGPVHAADTDFRELGLHLTELVRHPELVRQMQFHQHATVPRWSEYRDIYLEELERVCT